MRRGTIYTQAAREATQMVSGSSAALDQAIELAVSNVGEAWTPPSVKVFVDDEMGRPWKYTYIPLWVNQVLVLRAGAIDEVGPLLEPYGILRPLQAEGERLAVFGARLLSGTIDETLSEIRRFSSGKIMVIPRPVFKPAKVSGAGAFRLAENPRGPLYFEQSLVERICATGFAQIDDFRVVFSG